MTQKKKTEKLLTIKSMPDAMGVPLQIGDWVTFASGQYGDMLFGKIIKFNDKSMLITKRRGKDIRRNSKQVVKVSEEQLTLYWFSL